MNKRFFPTVLFLSILLLLIIIPPVFNSAHAQTCPYTTTASDSITGSVNITYAGTYNVWSRILAPDTANNSFYLQIDGGCPVNIGDSSNITPNTFTWVNYQDGNSVSQVTVPLTAGNHNITLTRREDAVGVDKILFTNDAQCVPAGTGTNCPPLAYTPTPAPATPTPLVSSQNLIQNGGFEVAGDWKTGYYSGTGTITRTTADRHTGSYSYLLQGDTTSSSGQVFSGPSNKIPVTPGTSYEYKAWYKGSGALLFTKWFDAQGAQISGNFLSLPDANDWTQADRTVTAPANAATLWVFAHSYHTTSPIYFDDLELYDLSVSQFTPTPIVATPTPTLYSTPTPTSILFLTSTPTPTNIPTPKPTATPTPVPTSTPLPTATPTPAGTTNGLQAVYYNNNNFTGTTLSRIDSTVNFNWGTASPDKSIASDTFSTVWTGYVVPKYSQKYTFYLNVDDGGRLWINGQKIIDRWYYNIPTESSGSVKLTANKPYSIRIEYVENYGAAKAQLSWSSNSQSKQVIPQSQLISN